MVYLAAGVVLVGLVGALNLVLSVGMVRRLRQHTEHLNRLLAGEPAEPLPAGAVVAGLTGTTTDGEPVSRTFLTGRTLVGFFAPACQACEPLVPEFLGLAGSMGGRERVVAVVGTAGGAPDGDADRTGEYVARLAGSTRVVVEEDRGPLQEAFQVTGFPMFYLVDSDGTVIAGGFGLHEVTAAAREGRVVA